MNARTLATVVLGAALALSTTGCANEPAAASSSVPAGATAPTVEVLSEVTTRTDSIGIPIDYQIVRVEGVCYLETVRGRKGGFSQNEITCPTGSSSPSPAK